VSVNDPWWMRPSKRTDWMESGLCRQTDPDLFFPEQGSNMTRRAKRVCRSCPVMDTCLDYALDFPGIDGVWGGTTQRERNGMIRRARKAA
jgi:WhiB family redox-sensing transcriptional regulator